MANKSQARGKASAPVIFDMTNQECLWSKAGAVPYRLCHNAFDCLSCGFDKAMTRQKKYGWTAAGLNRPAAGMGRLERWRDTPPGERYCRHMLTGRVSYKLCIHQYNCADCAYDQMLDDESLAGPAGDVQMTYAAGFKLPAGYYFHPGHVWARVEYGGRVRVGLDDFAARLFGPADEFRLPPLGAAVRGNGMEFGFSRQGRPARAVSPVEGVVTARNPEVLKRAAAAHDSPYGEGWLVLLEPTRLQRGLRGLLSGDDSVDWMEREAQRLSDIITSGTGQRLAATGGRAAPDIYGVAPGLDWNRLVREFLAP
jgi:glycine cleavage system H lipoate-binding protein